MKRNVPLPALIAIGVVVLIAICWYGSRALGVRHHDSQPLVSVERLQSQNSATYSGRQ